MTESGDQSGLEPVRFPVDRSKVAELARAFGDEDPIWFDGRAAERAGFDAPPVPLTATALVDHWRRGGALASAEAAGLHIPSLLHGEVAWEYLVPVRVGEALTASAEITGVRTREGKRGGKMTIVTVETSFENQRGEVAVKRRDTLIETEARP